MTDPLSPTGIEAPGPVAVVVSDEQADVALDADRWARLAAAALATEGVRDGELTLTFVDRDEIAALNEEHMGHVGPTDVLSFPLDAPASVGAVDTLSAQSFGPRLLGDIVVCPAVAVESAPAHAGSVDDELALLVVHGLLHILGHDHADPDETAAMRERELALLVEHHWHGPPPPEFTQDHRPS